jgi:hypothetical protein
MAEPVEAAVRVLGDQDQESDHESRGARSRHTSRASSLAERIRRARSRSASRIRKLNPFLSSLTSPRLNPEIPFDPDEIYRLPQDEDEEESSENSMPLPSGSGSNVKKMAANPMGRLLLNLAQANNELAIKLGKTTSLDVASLSRDFMQAMELRDQDLAGKILASEHSIGKNLLAIEMNSASNDVGVQPPTHFSPRNILKNWNDRKECLRLFPVNSKFSGQTGKDGSQSINVIEYLNMLTRAQEVCNLSKKEFLEMVLSTTTAKAHSLVSEYVELGESIPNLYHSLLLN